MRVAFGVFLILHGLIHLAIYAPPSSPDAPWETNRSWVLGPLGLKGTARRGIAIALAAATAAVYLVAGIALIAGAGWWGPAAIVASVISLVLMLGYFHPWLSFGVLLDAGIIWAAVAGWPE